MNLREKFARIIHSEYPHSFRVKQSKGGKRLRAATWGEINEREKQKCYKVSDRLIRHLLRIGEK